MSKTYEARVEKGKTVFEISEKTLPEYVMTASPPPQAESEYAITARLGDPDLIHCLAYKNIKAEGGAFVCLDENGVLFVAFATDNLAYALAMGFFGKLVADVRYGADIFEEL